MAELHGALEVNDDRPGNTVRTMADAQASSDPKPALEKLSAPPSGGSTERAAQVESLNDLGTKRSSLEKKSSPTDQASQQAQSEALQSIIARRERRRMRPHATLPSLSPRLSQSGQASSSKTVAVEKVPSFPDATSAKVPGATLPAARESTSGPGRPSAVESAPVQPLSERGQPALGHVLSAEGQRADSGPSIRTKSENLAPPPCLMVGPAVGPKRPLLSLRERALKTPVKLSGITITLPSAGQEQRTTSVLPAQTGLAEAVSRADPVNAEKQAFAESRQPANQDLPEPKQAAPQPEASKQVTVDTGAPFGTDTSPRAPKLKVVEGERSKSDVVMREGEGNPRVSPGPAAQRGDKRASSEVPPGARSDPQLRNSHVADPVQTVLEEMGPFLKQLVRVIKGMSESSNSNFSSDKARGERRREKFLKNLLENFAKQHNIENALRIRASGKNSPSRPKVTEKETGKKTVSREVERRTKKVASSSDGPQTKKLKTTVANDASQPDRKSLGGFRSDRGKGNGPERKWNSMAQEGFSRSLRVIKLFPGRFKSWGLMMKRGVPKAEEVVFAAGRVRQNLDSLQRPITSEDVSSSELGSWLLGLHQNTHVYAQVWHIAKTAPSTQKRKKDEVDVCTKYLTGFINLVVWANTVVYWFGEWCRTALAASDASKETIAELEKIAVPFLEEPAEDYDFRPCDHLLKFLKTVPEGLNDSRLDALGPAIQDLRNIVKIQIDDYVDKVTTLSKYARDLSETFLKLAKNEGDNSSEGPGKNGDNNDEGSGESGRNNNGHSGAGSSKDVSRSAKSGGNRDFGMGEVFAADIPVPRRKQDAEIRADRGSDSSPKSKNRDEPARKKSDFLLEKKKLQQDPSENRAKQNLALRFEKSKNLSSANTGRRSSNERESDRGRASSSSQPRDRKEFAKDSDLNKGRNDAKNRNDRDVAELNRSPLEESFKFLPTKPSYSKGTPASSTGRAGPSTSKGGSDDATEGRTSSSPNVPTGRYAESRRGSANDPPANLDNPSLNGTQMNSSGLRSILRKTEMPNKPSRINGKRVAFADRPEVGSFSGITREENEALFHDGFDLLGESNKVQAALVRPRVDAMSRGSVYVLFAFFQHVITCMKYQSQGYQPPDVERLRIPYPPSVMQNLQQSLNIVLPAQQNLRAVTNSRANTQSGRNSANNAQQSTNGPTTHIGAHTPITGLRSAPSPIDMRNRHVTTTGLRSVPVHVTPPTEEKDRNS